MRISRLSVRPLGVHDAARLRRATPCRFHAVLGCRAPASSRPWPPIRPSSRARPWRRSWAAGGGGCDSGWHESRSCPRVGSSCSTRRLPSGVLRGPAGDVRRRCRMRSSPLAGAGGADAAPARRDVVGGGGRAFGLARAAGVRVVAATRSPAGRRGLSSAVPRRWSWRATDFSPARVPRCRAARTASWT